jgi:nucleoside-diphosphate-sugar epimerase
MSVFQPAKRTVAVIGGNGFIGQVLIGLLLDADFVVRVLDVASAPSRANVEFRFTDVRDTEQLFQNLENCDLIVNLAAIHRDDVRPLSLYDEVNVGGARNICEAAEKRNIAKIIFTSSVAIYGMQSGEPDEDAPAKPFNAYGRTKWAAETVYSTWQKGGDGRRLVIVRPTVVFGPKNRGNVYNLIALLAGGRFVMVGSGTNRKSMAYVGNVAAFLTHLARSSMAEPGISTYNYCDKPDFSMNELLELIQRTLGKREGIPLRLPYAIGIAAGTLLDVAARLSGRTFPISRIRIEKFCATTTFAARRLRETGFTPPEDLKDSLKRTIEVEFRPTTHC